MDWTAPARTSAPDPEEAEEAIDATAEVARLAELSGLDYERERVAAAKRLNVRASALDKLVSQTRPQAPEEADLFAEVEPWPEPVDGAALAEEVRDRLRAHIVFAAPADADAMTLWIFGTYLMDVWRLWPKVLITSPVKGCGKTALLETVAAFTPRAMPCANLSAAVLFRAIEKWRPTLLLDEADRFLKDREELNGLINAGHTRAAAFVFRCVGDDNDVQRFSVWCPQVFAGIGRQADTLEDRSLIIALQRKMPGEATEKMPFDLAERMLRARRQIARWADDHRIAIAASEIEPPPCVNDRRQDNFTPLVRIAAALGASWPARVAAAYAMKSAEADDDDGNIAVQLLRDVAAIAEDRGGWKLKTADLLADLVTLEARPWAEWRHGRPITGHSVARMLRPFGLKSGKFRFGETALQGYDPREIQAAFARYCRDTPFQSGTPEQVNKINELDGSQSGTEAPSVPLPEHDNSLKNNECSIVPLRKAWADFEAQDDPLNPDAWR